jgi:hypothetical protein
MTRIDRIIGKFVNKIAGRVDKKMIRRYGLKIDIHRMLTGAVLARPRQMFHHVGKNIRYDL